jgi:pyruvate dehydrogenase E2 component (dihydrolipoamide acetyltransferase)
MGLFRMPSLGADMDEGTLLEWLVAPGDPVHRGDVVAVIDTAKSAIDVEVFEDGTVAELLVDPGTLCEVGTPLARIEAPGAATPVAPSPSVGGGETGERKAARRTPTDAPKPHGSAGLRVATPPIRHLLHQFGLEPGNVTGTGPDGRITREDVLAAAGESSAGGPPARVSRRRVTPRARKLAARRGIDLGAVSGSAAGGTVTASDVPAAKKPAPVDRSAAMRAVTAALMARAAREIPHYYVVDTFDVTAALSWLRETNAQRKIRDRILPAALFLRAAVVAARAVPELNGHWDEEFAAADGVDLGVAVATRAGGLVTPRIVDAHDLSLSELMKRLADLVKRARGGRLKGSELQPGSITVSSLADGGPEALFGVIYPPQVALVGVGGVATRPWIVDGGVVPRETLTVSLAADHRATDGRTGARFLAEFGSALTHPEEL